MVCVRTENSTNNEQELMQCLSARTAKNMGCVTSACGLVECALCHIYIMALSGENHYPRLCENKLLNSCHGETDTSDRWKMQVVLVQTDDKQLPVVSACGI